MIKILEGNGFKKVRSDKHVTYKKTAPNGKVLTTWITHHNEITVFVIQHVISQTGKTKEEFH